MDDPPVPRMGDGGFRRAGKHHTWTAPNNTAHGRVTMRRGRAYVTFGNQQSPDIFYPGPPDRTRVHGRSVTVHSRSYCRYHVSGSYIS
jgi:hypothetical protein